MGSEPLSPPETIVSPVRSGSINTERRLGPITPNFELEYCDLSEAYLTPLSSLSETFEDRFANPFSSPVSEREEQIIPERPNKAAQQISMSERPRHFLNELFPELKELGPISNIVAVHRNSESGSRKEDSPSPQWTSTPLTLWSEEELDRELDLLDGGTQAPAQVQEISVDEESFAADIPALRKEENPVDGPYEYELSEVEYLTIQESEETEGECGAKGDVNEGGGSYQNNFTNFHPSIVDHYPHHFNDFPLEYYNQHGGIWGNPHHSGIRANPDWSQYPTPYHSFAFSMSPYEDSPQAYNDPALNAFAGSPVPMMHLDLGPYLDQPSAMETPPAHPFDMSNPMRPVVHSHNLEPVPSPLQAESAAARDDANNFLVQLRDQGISYKEIKARLNLSEAESTLRGRYRTLKKHKSERPRKPVWTPKDEELLVNLVTTSVLSHEEDDGSGKAGGAKWKIIGEEIYGLGGSHKFGPGTCKKKYQTLVDQGGAPSIEELEKRRSWTTRGGAVSERGAIQKVRRRRVAGRMGVKRADTTAEDEKDGE